RRAAALQLNANFRNASSPAHAGTRMPSTRYFRLAGAGAFAPCGPRAASVTRRGSSCKPRGAFMSDPIKTYFWMVHYDTSPDVPADGLVPIAAGRKRGIFVISRNIYANHTLDFR